jgi:hypothetical protein
MMDHCLDHEYAIQQSNIPSGLFEDFSVHRQRAGCAVRTDWLRLAEDASGNANRCHPRSNSCSRNPAHRAA